MYTLVFDTTAKSCSIALLKDKETISKFEKEMDFGQGELLIPEIKKMLGYKGLSFDNINVVAVCVGPGSFTGVRSSISAARSFGIARPDLSILGVSAFDAYAHDISSELKAEVNAVIIETKRDDFYYQLFDKSMNKISEPSAAHKEYIISELRGKEVTITGDGVERFLFTPTGLNFKTIMTPSHLSLDALSKTVLYKLSEKKIDYPKPLYLRAPDVCRKN